MYAWLASNLDLCQVITSISSVIISTMAIVISIVTFNSQRKREVSIVTPLLGFEFIDLPCRIAVKLRNDGLGVAKINCQLFEGMSEGKGASLIEMIESTVCDDSIKNRGIWKRYLDSYNDYAIAPNSEKFLIEIESNNQKLLDDVRDVLKQIEATICYTDIYGNPQLPLKMNFEYYNRRNEVIITSI